MPPTCRNRAAGSVDTQGKAGREAGSYWFMLSGSLLPCSESSLNGAPGEHLPEFQRHTENPSRQEPLQASPRGIPLPKTTHSPWPFPLQLPYSPLFLLKGESPLTGQVPRPTSPGPLYNLWEVFLKYLCKLAITVADSVCRTRIYERTSSYICR